MSNPVAWFLKPQNELLLEHVCCSDVSLWNINVSGVVYIMQYLLNESTVSHPQRVLTRGSNKPCFHRPLATTPPLSFWELLYYAAPTHNIRAATGDVKDKEGASYLPYPQSLPISTAPSWRQLLPRSNGDPTVCRWHLQQC
jgi:hypothetical protein